jgi:disulfide bond formation protein DsbB
MFPILLLLSIALWRKDTNIAIYVLWLSSIGAIIAFYHTLLQYGLVPKTINCGIGADCTTSYLDLFGFITIPLLSLIAFSIITICMVVHLRKINEKRIK